MHVLSVFRLEYLVMDDIHVLVEVFTHEIRDVMKAWRETLLDPDRPGCLQFKPKVRGFKRLLCRRLPCCC